MNRNRLLTVCLAFLLLFLQQGAMLHAMSHAFGDGKTHSRLDVDHGEAERCVQCLAYTAASNAAAGSSPAFTLTQFGTPTAAPSIARIVSRVPCAYLSRAPPFVRYA